MQSTGSSRLRAIVLVAAALVALLIVATTTGLGATSAEAAAQQTPSNNSTVQHERPSEASGSGDSQRVSQWLEGRLASQLQGSAINLSQGQYDQARGVLGEGYSSRLGQYVDVAGETANDSDNQASQTFQEAQQTQRDYANATQEYRETYETYEQARREGNTTAARETARELETLSGRVQRLNTSLQQDYETISNLTGANTSVAQRSVTNTTRDVSAQQATVRSQTFVETRLTVQANDSTVAFDDPIVVSGQVRTANGTALGNVTGRIAVADRSYRITTDSEGHFEVTYRPVSLAVNATTARVRFLPANTSAYLGAAANISVAVTQVTPQLEIVGGRARGGYGDRLNTMVVATVGGRPVPGLGLTARLGGTAVSARTTDAGRVTLSPRVPAALRAGERSLEVSHTRAAVAVGPNTTATTVTITETATNLTVNATNEGVLRVRGRLSTAAGRGVGAQSIRLTIGGTERVVETNATGWYRLAIGNVSALDTDGNTTIAVTTRFAGTGTNLQSSESRTTLVRGQEATGDSGLPSVVVLGSLAVGVLLVAGVVGWSRRDTDTTPSGPEPAPEDPTTAAAASPPDQSRQWLTRAQSALGAGDHERAIVTAYGAVRRRFEQDASVEPTLTHREFLATAEAPLAPDERAALSMVATAYEEAVFQGVVTSTAATQAVEATAELLSDSAEPVD